MFKVLSYTNTLTADSTSNDFVELVNNNDLFIDKTFNKTLHSIFSNNEETFDFLRNFADNNRDGIIQNDMDENYLVTANSFYEHDSKLYLKIPTGIALSSNKIVVNRPDFNSLQRQLFEKTLADQDLENYEIRTELSTGKLWVRVALGSYELVATTYLYFGCTDVEWDTNVSSPLTAYAHPMALLQAIADSTNERLAGKITDITKFVSYPIFDLVEGDYLLFISDDNIDIRNFGTARNADEITLFRITVANDLSYTLVDYREFLPKKPVSPSEQFLLGYWSMEDLPAVPDGVGGHYSTSLYDNTNNGLDGDIYHCESIKSVEGGALVFGVPITETDSKVSITGTSNINLSSGGTILAFFNADAGIGAEAYIVDKSTETDTDYTIKITSGELRCCVGLNTNYIAYPIVTGTNYNVAFSFDASWMKLYINYKLVDKKQNTLLPSTNVRDIAIGNRAGVGALDKTFSGLIDEVKIFSSILTAAEIDALGTYKAGGKFSIGTVTNYFKNNDISFGQGVTIEGDLIVNGSTTTINTTELTVEDTIITINKNQIGTPASGLMAGMEVERGDEVNYSFKFREFDDLFVVGEVGSEQPVATREAIPNDRSIPFWDATSSSFLTDLKFKYSSDTVSLTTTIASTNTTSGSLVVSGGVGIGGAVNIGLDSYINGIRAGKGAGNIVSNTAFGITALNANTTGTWNTAIGYQALSANTYGFQNVAVGYNSLRRNIFGSNNIAIGVETLQANTTGINNIAIGYDSLYTNISGRDNTALGYFSLRSSNGDYNTAIGSYSLSGNYTGVNNTAIGYGSLNVNSGVNNIGIGYTAGSSETGSNKLFIDSTNRTDEAGGRTNSFIYGDMSLKTLLINADVTTDALRLRNATVATATAGALIVDGGVDIAKNLVVESTTASAAYDSGAVIISGGVGIAGAVNTNSNMTIGGTLAVNGTTFTVGASDATARTATIHASTYIGDITNQRNLIVNGNITLDGLQVSTIPDAIKYALVLG